MLVHAYDIVLLLLILPCVSASRVRLVSDKDSDEELFVPTGAMQPAARPAFQHTAHVPQPDMAGPGEGPLPAIRNPQQTRRAFVASAAAGASILGGAHPANADGLFPDPNKKYERKDGKYIPPIEAENDPTLVILRVAQIAASQEFLCRSVAAGKEGFVSNLQVSNLIPVVRSEYDNNVKIVLKSVIKGNITLPKSSGETISISAFDFGIFLAAATNNLFETMEVSGYGRDNDLNKEELLRDADRYFRVRECLFLILSILPRELQNRVYDYAQDNPLPDCFGMGIECSFLPDFFPKTELKQYRPWERTDKEEADRLAVIEEELRKYQVTALKPNE